MNEERRLVLPQLTKGGTMPGEIVDRTASVVASGGVIVYPTDTIYGLGCDALNASSVRRVYEMKRRPEEKPMIILVRSIESLAGLVGEIGPEALEIARAFWPGPLTILFRADRARLPWLSGSTGKIGVRIPAHPFCQSVMEASGRPLLSTSANLSGQEYVSDVGRLQELFLGQVDLFIDAGTLPPSPPSTIVDGSGEHPFIVREGAIARGALQGFLHD